MQLGATLLPSLQIFTNWNSAAATPSVESAERLDAIRSPIVLGEDCQAHRLREWIKMGNFDLAAVVDEPVGGVAREALGVGKGRIAANNVLAISGNGIAEGGPGGPPSTRPLLNAGL